MTYKENGSDRIALWKLLVIVALLLGTLVTTGDAICANRCSGHGDCNKYSRCDCWSGWEGGDCSRRRCPTGVAWSDLATGDDEAHNAAVCSNRGKCDYTKGRCKCMEGFTGSACERSTCGLSPVCSGHGKCTSIMDYAEKYRDDDSVQHSYAGAWDAPLIHRCVCDYGYAGYDCSLRECPRGDDPLTTGQVNEVQLIVCGATAGSWVLYYEDRVSYSIPHSATADDLERAIKGISIIPDVAISFSLPASEACNASSINVISVEFLENFGRLRPMWAYTSGLSGGSLDPALQVTADGSTVYDSDGVGHVSVKGTKEDVYCSNRGDCDFHTGVCECFQSSGDIFASSNGYGSYGIRGDCGYAVSTIGGCPGEIACSGHGHCNTSTFSCQCMDGWQSGDCSQRTCPMGFSWYSYPSEDDKAHDVWDECSGAGHCIRTTGVCECGALFYGAACEYMVCPGGGAVNPNSCSGHGRCMTMAELATHAEVNGDLGGFTYGTDPNNGNTWDAHRIHGCLCDDDYTGYMCEDKVCQTGDDPGTYVQVSETQLLMCTATNGSFTLIFRQQETAAISFNATSDELEEALEALTSIGTVVVTYHNDIEALCTADSSSVVSVAFLTEHSDVPDVVADTGLLVDDGNGGSLGSGNVTFAYDGDSLNGYLSMMGTTEEETCSHRGLCNALTGECKCFTNWGSSNGYGMLGERGDCGFRIPVTANLRGSQEASKIHSGQIYEDMKKVDANAAYKDMARVAIATKMRELANN